MRYLMIHCVDESTVDWWDDGPTDPESNEETRAVEAWNAEMNARGIIVGGGFLQPTSAATTIKVRDGEVLVSDGPFAETKEQIAGFCVLECTDLDEAIEVASAPDGPDRHVRAAAVRGVAAVTVQWPCHTQMSGQQSAGPGARLP